MIITKHAVRRIKQRLGVRTKERAKRIASRALSKGIPLKELPEEVRKFIDENCNNARALVYKNFIYIFRGNALITLFGLPQDLHFKSKEDIIKEKQKIAKAQKLKCPICGDIRFTSHKDKKRFQLECLGCKYITKRKKSIELCKKSIERKLKKLGPVD
ncbi:MAG: hypothetical protein ACXAC5_05185 [Promethearchaeota archaeon]